MRFIIGILVTLGLIILVLVMLFHGGGGKTASPKSLNLSDYTHSNSVAKLVMQAPVQADQTYQQIEIDVSNSNVSFTLYNGYQQSAVSTTTYPNNDDAYANFLKGLQNEGYTRGNSDKSMQDERGVCPLGTRNVYSFSNDSTELMRFWSTSCGTATFKGRASNVTALFKLQVPNYNTVLQSTSFNSSNF